VFNRNFLLLAPEPGVSGTGPDTDALARGDILPDPDDKDVDPDHPDAAAAAEALTSKLEAEKAEAEKGEEKDPKKNARIPLERHEAVLAKEREKRADLEQKLAQYEKGSQIASVNEDITNLENSVVSLEKEYAQLLTDGEIDKATAVMAKIRKAERDMSEAKSDMKIHAAEIRATERARFNTALERIEVAYPTLNPDHADYDQAIMDEVVELKEAYEIKGLTPTTALQKAVRALVEPRTTKQEMATTTKPNVSEKDVSAERKKEAVGKTAEAMAKQPASLGKGGVDSDRMGGGKPDAATVIKMSQKDFAKLDRETLAELRGDNL